MLVLQDDILDLIWWYIMYRVLMLQHHWKMHGQNQHFSSFNIWADMIVGCYLFIPALMQMPGYEYWFLITTGILMSLLPYIHNSQHRVNAIGPTLTLIWNVSWYYGYIYIYT